MSKMTPYERCMAALNWKKPDRVPVIPQNSDHAIHLAGYDMIEASKESKKLAQKEQRKGQPRDVIKGRASLFLSSEKSGAGRSSRVSNRKFGHTPSPRISLIKEKI